MAVMLIRRMDSIVMPGSWSRVPTDRVALLLSTGLTVSRPVVPSGDPARFLRDPGNGCLPSGGKVDHGQPEHAL
jgi:hypothetical protein